MARVAQLSAVVGCALAPIAGAVVRFVGFERYRFLLSPVTGAPPDDRAREVARGLAAAARHGPVRLACLAESLMIAVVLRRLGYASQIAIGVAQPRGRFGAHAWVQIGDEVVGASRPAVSNFVPFSMPSEL